MNERIRELAQEVFSFKYKSNPNELNPDHNMDHIHKFAELIVRGCCDWIEGSPSTDAGQLLLTKSFIIANLKGHFGVEE